MSTVVQPNPEMRARAKDMVDALERVHIAESEEERNAVFRFRYAVYVEELGRKLGNGDHRRRHVHDEEDDKPYTILLYTADDHGALTGTIRVRHWGPGEVPEKDWNTFSMELFEGLADLGTAELGRLMVRPDRRGQLALVSIACALFQLNATELGVDVAFLNCATGLVRHYRLLGFRTYAGRLVPTPDGIEVPLVLFPSDRDYLEQAGSFLVQFVDVFYGSGGKRPLDLTPFASLLDADSAPVQLDQAAVWHRIDRLRGAVRSQPRMLDALSDETVRKLSENGFLMKVPAGELLTEEGLAQQEIFVILAGAFEVYHGSRRLGVIGTGDVIGEVAFFGTSGRRSASVVAATDGQVLVLRRHFLDELRERDPACAAEILFELARVLADRTYMA
jgi:hypothetical protein